MLTIKELSWLQSANKGATKERGERPNSTEAIEQIVKLEKKIFPKHESLATTFHRELCKRNSGLLYAIEDASNSSLIAGYVMYSFPSCLLGSITKLAVRESCRRKGIGEALLRAAIERCRSRKVERVSLHVDPLRTEALALYRKLGFSVDSFVSSYYSEDRHAYRMFLDLS